MTEPLWPWEGGPEHHKWPSAEASRHLLGDDETTSGRPVPREWLPVCLRRLRAMRQELRGAYVGLGHLIDWMVAALVARENMLLLGPPGVAKTELAVRTFELLGLKPPEVAPGLPIDLGADPAKTDPERTKRSWDERAERERRQQKYFHYLLSRFTQPEELLGPVEISLLRQGVLARVNFGLLTGPGVRAAFLDEIFKASSNILNTLLTLTQERQYFNWGGMVPADLMMLIGASNELPGAFGAGRHGIAMSQDEFPTLYAFLDRFPLRLLVPLASGGSNESDPTQSNLAQAFRLALDRESRRFTEGRLFPARNPDMPCINDLLCVGRAMLEREPETTLFDPEQRQRFDRAFLITAAVLQEGRTRIDAGPITWTISPRKLRALYKIALAHALLLADGFTPGETSVSIGAPQMCVFTYIWDAPESASDLRTTVLQSINRHFGADVQCM